ncbi:DJ-1/PfpI family protein, partial [Acinetobacter pittii]|uniref:DJ-1/PfpI family protein n=1 Tax=Acinetobacter pittii TaxID=48296 RepID=UPI0028140B4B
AGPTVLGHLGLLKGKKYTCFQSMDEDFQGEYQYAYTVTDGNIITGISAAASIEFAFAILEKLIGHEKTEALKQSIYYDAAH